METRMIKYLLIFLLIASPVIADTISIDDYAERGQVTATNLNNKFNTLEAEINGNLTNENADTDDGYRFFEVAGELPAAGNQGRVVYLTSNDFIYTDNGSSFDLLVKASGTSVTGSLIYYDGNGWTVLNQGTTDYALVSNGSEAIPAFEILSMAGGGTGEALTDPGGDRIMFWDDDPGDIAWLSAGTGLTITGTTITSTVPAMTNISEDTETSSTTSDVIEVSADKNYRVFIEIENATDTDLSSLFLRINAEVGESYSWSRVESLFGAGADTFNEDSADNEIEFPVIEQSSNNGYLKGEFFISTHPSGGHTFFIQGDYFYLVVGQTLPSRGSLWGAEVGADVPSSFTITASHNCNWRIELYEISP